MPRIFCGHFYFIKRIIGIVLVTLLSFTSAHGETVGGLTDQFEALVRTEADLLNEREVVRQHIENPDLVLLGEPNGAIKSISRMELTQIIDRFIERAQILGLDEIKLSTMPWYARMAAEAAIESGMARDIVIDRLQTRGKGLIDGEREKLAAINEMLEDIRAKAAEVIARRDALRKWVQTGEEPTDGIVLPQIIQESDDMNRREDKDASPNNVPEASADPDNMSPDNNSVCRDQNTPVDHHAYFSGIYGGSGPYMVKGAHICIGNTLKVITGSQIDVYDCAPNSPFTCKYKGPSLVGYQTRTKDNGHTEMWLGMESITLRPPS